METGTGVSTRKTKGKASVFHSVRSLSLQGVGWYHQYFDHLFAPQTLHGNLHVFIGSLHSKKNSLF